MYSFSYLEQVCCSMSSSNCCFLTFIQVSREAGQMVWYSHLFQNFPHFIVIHTVEGFGVIKKVDPLYYRIIFHLLYFVILLCRWTPVSVGSTSVISTLGCCKTGAYSIETILGILIFFWASNILCDTLS